MGNKRTKEDDPKVSAYGDLHSKTTDKLYGRMDEYQRSFFEAIKTHKVVFVDEPAGTGKTTVAVSAGLDAMRQGKRLIYIRFASSRGEQLGATPGELEDKEAKYMYPFYEALRECGVNDNALNYFMNEGNIETRTDTTERGRNYKDCFIIIDEAQNSSDIEQLRLILTRLHDTSTAVVIGHSGQTDSKVKKYGGLNAFQVYQEHMTQKPWATKCELKINYRGEVARWADEVDEFIKEVK